MKCGKINIGQRVSTYRDAYQVCLQIYIHIVGINECFVLMTYGEAWIPFASGGPKKPPTSSRSSQGGDPPSLLPPASEPLMDNEGYDTNISDIWAGDDEYDI